MKQEISCDNSEKSCNYHLVKEEDFSIEHLREYRCWAQYLSDDDILIAIDSEKAANQAIEPIFIFADLCFADGTHLEGAVIVSCFNANLVYAVMVWTGKQKVTFNRNLPERVDTILNTIRRDTGRDIKTPFPMTYSLKNVKPDALQGTPMTMTGTFDVPGWGS